MFYQNCTCPKGKDVKNEQLCKGCRNKEGVLNNDCAARCDAYKNYVRKEFV